MGTLVRNKWAPHLMSMAIGFTYLKLLLNLCLFRCLKLVSVIRGSIKISSQFEISPVLDLAYTEIISVPTSFGQLRLLEFYMKWAIQQEFALGHNLCLCERLKMSSISELDWADSHKVLISQSELAVTRSEIKGGMAFTVVYTVLWGHAEREEAIDFMLNFPKLQAWNNLRA